MKKVKPLSSQTLNWHNHIFNLTWKKAWFGIHEYCFDRIPEVWKKYNEWMSLKHLGRFRLMNLLICAENIRVFVSWVVGQQKLSVQRRLVKRQNGQNYSLCDVGQRSSQVNKKRSWLQGWRPDSFNNIALLLLWLTWVLPPLIPQYHKPEDQLSTQWKMII